MTAPTLVTAGSAVQSQTNTSNPVPKPLGVALGDAIVVSFLMNGTPALPTGWVLKNTAGNANTILYARVDGTNIPAVDDGQTFTFGNGGGGVIYYDHAVALVRGARSGDPFDGNVTMAQTIGGTSSPPVSVTTTFDDTLLVLFTHHLFAVPNPTITSVTAPLTMFSTTAAYSHIGSGAQPVQGASGNKVMGFGTTGGFEYAQLGAFAPASEDDLIDVHGSEGGRKRWGLRK